MMNTNERAFLLKCHHLYEGNIIYDLVKINHNLMHIDFNDKAPYRMISHPDRGFIVLLILYDW